MKRNRKGTIRLLVGGGILTFILGNVLAAAININNGTTVNFGQGAAGMTACANGISYTVTSDFGTSGFLMTGIQVTVTDGTRLDASGSPIAGTAGTVGACDLKTMTVYGYSVDTAGATGAIATMWVVLNSVDNAGATEIYTFAGAASAQTDPTETPQYDSAVVTPVTLTGLAFEITD